MLVIRVLQRCGKNKRCREMYYKDLAHTITKAGKYPGPQCKGPGTRRADGSSSRLKSGDPCPSSKAGRKPVLMRTWIEWNSLTLEKGICVSQSTDSNVHLLQDPLTDTPIIVLNQIFSLPLTQSSWHRSCEPSQKGEDSARLGVQERVEVQGDWLGRWVTELI